MESFACKSDCDLGHLRRSQKRVVQLLQLEHSTVFAGDRWSVQWAQVRPSCIAGIKLGVGHVGTAHAALEALGNKVGKPVDSPSKRETAKRVPRELPEHLHELEPVAAASHPVRYYPTHAHTSMHRAYGKRMEARAVSLCLSRPVISPMSCLSTVTFR